MTRQISPTTQFEKPQRAPLPDGREEMPPPVASARCRVKPPGISGLPQGQAQRRSEQGVGAGAEEQLFWRPKARSPSPPSVPGSCPPLGLSPGHQRDACWFLSRARPLLIPGGAGAREQDMGSPGQIQGVAPRRAPDVGGWSPIRHLPLSQRRGPRKAGPHAPCWAQPRREAQTTAINGSGVTPPSPSPPHWP